MKKGVFMKKHFATWKPVFLISALVAASTDCAALAAPALAQGNLQTPFQLDVSASSARSLLGSIDLLQAPAGEVHAALPDMSLSDPYTVAITGIQMDVKYAFEPP